MLQRLTKGYLICPFDIPWKVLAISQKDKIFLEVPALSLPSCYYMYNCLTCGRDLLTAE